MKRFAKVSMLLTVMALVMSSCNCYKKMAKDIDDIQIKSNPEVLALVGKTVNADVNVTIPAKYFNKKAVLKVTPVLKFEGGELTGTPKYLQGEKVKDNYTIIPFNQATTYTQNVTFPYDARAKLSTLELRIDAKCKNGDFVYITSIPVAQGIRTVQESADWTAYMSIMPDNFKRVTTITQTADIHYQVNSSRVNPRELTKEQVKLFEQFVQENAVKDRTVLGNIYAKGYASPEGPVKYNEELSRDRSNTGKAAITKELSSVPTATYDAAAYGEDWDGFKELVEASDMKDKNLILQVLNMYSSPVQRDNEIKNMSAVFSVLKKDVLPQLRRTQLVANADITGKTDEELIAASKSNINSLTVEEMLFTATLVSDNAEKAKIYKAAADKYNDVRAHNNYGVALAWSGDLAGAKTAINKAASIGSSPEISNNLGAIALAEGKTEEAKRYFSALNTADAKANKALLALAEGDYTSAVKDLNGYNLAVAQLCNGNVAQSKAALGNIKTADADYLRAVIAMREGDSAGAIANLKSAYAKDSSLRNKAKTDIEFAKLFGTSEFAAL